VQNHLLEVVAMLTMEAPGRNHPDALRDEKRRVFEAMSPLAPAEVVRGQFRGYRTESGVAPNSNVETFAAVRLHIDTERWAGVPFYLRAGKQLPVTATEIRVDLKPPLHPVFDAAGNAEANYLRFRLSPSVTISIGARTKSPGEEMSGESVELLLTDTPGDEMTPYERLLGDALRGDPSLFVREDEVQAAWRVVEPVLDLPAPVEEYEPKTWGPASAHAIIDGSWNNPS
jgi:glucose-6-phosphate 1-dehydrogenase